MIADMLSSPIIPPSLRAQCAPGGGGINLADCLRLSDFQAVSEVYSSPAFLVNLIVRNIFVLAGIVLFLLVIYAGFKFIHGGKKGIEEATSIATTAVMGFLIMLAAYWIVQIVQLITGADIVL